MALAGDDMDEVLQKIYDIIHDDAKNQFEEYTLENVRSTIWSVFNSIVDAIRWDVSSYADDLAKRILDECVENKEE